MPKLSVTIITLNEAEHIASAIESASWADEIIVVDSGSTDGTVDIARAAGARKAKVAGPDRVRAVTGFEPGAVAPFPLPKVERVLVDRQVLVHDRVWIGAGSPHHVATLSPSDLVRLAKAEPVDAVAEAT